MMFGAQDEPSLVTNPGVFDTADINGLAERILPPLPAELRY